MLDTIREFGLAELSEADVVQTRDRHADFCIRLAESAGSRLQGADHARWLARLNQDVDNIRAARAWLSDRGDSERLCRLAAPMGTYWRYYGSISEGRTWLMEAIAGSANAAPSSRAAVLMTAGWLEAVGGDVAGGRDLLEQALQLADELGDRRRIADTLYHLGSTLIDLGDYELATTYIERGLEIAREDGHADLEGRLTFSSSLILSYVDSGRIADRRRLLLLAIDAATRAGDLQRVALCLNLLGGVEREAGNNHAALEDWNESVRLTREWGERAFLGSLLLALSRGQLEDGDFEGSRSSLLEGVRITREAGAMPDLIGSVASVAEWLDRIGVTDQARRDLDGRRTPRRPTRHGCAAGVPPGQGAPAIRWTATAAAGAIAQWGSKDRASTRCGGAGHTDGGAPRNDRT